jgi:twitching motility two-component system response regulator PilG
MAKANGPARVLVVDDSVTVRRSAELFLRQGGYEVILAEDGFDALAKVGQQRPDLIFCDVMMPRLDGYQTCTILKQCVTYADIPVVMLSSKDGVFDKARGKIAGAADYLTKPFSKKEMLFAAASSTMATMASMGDSGGSHADTKNSDR